MPPAAMPPVIHVIDVAHPARDPAAVEAELLEGWSHVRNSKELRILKIIHGRGSSGKGGVIREQVRNWAYRNQQRFPAVVLGETYDLFNPVVQEMRKIVGEYDDNDIGRGNSGVILIWIK